MNSKGREQTAMENGNKRKGVKRGHGYDKLTLYPSTFDLKHVGRVSVRTGCRTLRWHLFRERSQRGCLEFFRAVVWGQRGLVGQLRWSGQYLKSYCWA